MFIISILLSSRLVTYTCTIRPASMSAVVPAFPPRRTHASPPLSPAYMGLTDARRLLTRPSRLTQHVSSVWPQNLAVSPCERPAAIARPGHRRLWIPAKCCGSTPEVRRETSLDPGQPGSLWDTRPDCQRLEKKLNRLDHGAPPSPALDLFRSCVHAVS